MHTKTQVVTPEIAREWLDTKKNKHNRPITERVVQKYAQEMKAGRWKLNGEAIIFGKSGELLNGQHRLKACVQSGCSFETTVTFGVSDTAFNTIDNGRTRTLSDVLAVRGERYHKHIAPALGFVYRYANGMESFSSGMTGKKIATKQILEHLLETQPGIRQSAKYYDNLIKSLRGMLLPASIAVGLHYIFSLVDSLQADAFFDHFQSGLGLQATDPVYLLRQRLIAEARIAASSIRNEALYSYTVITWNAVRAGKTLSRLALQPAGSPLPKIVDVPRSLMKDLL